MFITTSLDMTFTHHTPRKSSSHKRKSQEQHQSRLPRNTTPTITEAICTQPRLLNAVDHQHAKGGADPRDPVNEVYVHLRAVARGVGVGCGVNEKEESKGELWEKSAWCERRWSEGDEG